MGRAALPVVVLAWWLLVAAVVATALSGAATSAPGNGRGTPARVNLPGLAPAQLPFPVPIERAAFDLTRRGYRESNEELLDEAATAYGWIGVTHGQAVLVLARDDDAVQVELLDGPYAGRTGWLEARQLGP